MSLILKDVRTADAGTYGSLLCETGVTHVKYRATKPLFVILRYCYCHTGRYEAVLCLR